jgi:uncharacterized protein (UPF0210 family)
MKIRSVTAHADLGSADLDAIADLLADAKGAFAREVQTVRASTVPQNGIHSSESEARRAAAALCGWAQAAHVDYVGGFGLGRLPSDSDLEFLSWIPGILGEFPSLFSNCQVAWGDTVHFGAIRASSELVLELSKIGGGMGNLQYAALCNCAEHNPFYPASYASGEAQCFTLSLEGADIAHKAFAGAGTLAEARDQLIALLRDAYCGILSSALELEEAHGIRFMGADMTLAPGPGEHNSIARALEALGLGTFGTGGTLFYSAFLADTIKAIGSEAGFSGLMYPVLEDSGIAKGAADGTVTIDRLLFYSAVCGTGLDCVPLPGNVTRDSVAAVLLDTAGLSVRLRKPLTARLMPLPGKEAGDDVSFSFPYFAPSRVMAVGNGAPVPDGASYTFIH